MGSHKTQEDELSKGIVEEILDESDEYDYMSSDEYDYMSSDEYDYMSSDEYDCMSASPNVRQREVSESRMSTLKGIMEALTDPNISMMGLQGKDDNDMDYLLQGVMRRVRRDNLFGVIVMVSIGKKPNLRRIQEEIARELGFSFQGHEQEEKAASCVFRNRDKEVVSDNARQLSDRIRREQKVLFILRDLGTILDLANLGIPFGADHQACKFILTSQSEEILSNHMNAQRTFTI